MKDFMTEGLTTRKTWEVNAQRLSQQQIGVGAVAANGLRRGLTDGEVLDLVRAEFPHGKTTEKTVACYRKWLRSVDETVPTQKDAERRRDALRRAQGYVVESTRKTVRRRLPGRLTMASVWD